MGLKLKAKAAVVPLVVVLLLLPTVSRAGKEENQQKALRGLKGVHVVVGKVKSQAERLGLTRDQIVTDVELRLRKAGVRVLTEKECLGTPGSPSLFVSLTTPFHPDIHDVVAFAIRVELHERVTVARGFETDGAIWGKAFVGATGTERIRELRESVVDEVDKFINAYLAANPK